uniref:Uncharacterized protein n=1 Tax=Arundo donax TaxID=35708 RepID=A0A0A9EYT3_ARUDO
MSNSDDLLVIPNTELSAPFTYSLTVLSGQPTMTDILLRSLSNS